MFFCAPHLSTSLAPGNHWFAFSHYRLDFSFLELYKWNHVLSTQHYVFVISTLLWVSLVHSFFKNFYFEIFIGSQETAKRSLMLTIVQDQNPEINTGTIGYTESRSVVSDSLRPHGLYNLWNSPGQDTGVGSLSLLQGIFPTQESNQGLLPLQADSLPTELSGNPS